MMIPCAILRSFTYSTDGIRALSAERGMVVAIPDDLIEGLAREGYLRAANASEMEGMAMRSVPENKVIAAAPENQAVGAAPQNKRAVAKGPGGRWYVVENGSRVSPGFATQEEAQAHDAAQ